MCILHVEDGVVGTLTRDDVDVEVDFLVARTRQQREARGVPAHHLEQLLEGDHGALALAHTHGLAGAQQVHELAERHVELAGMAHGADGGLHAGDVTVVVGAPNVDEAVEAAVELVGVVGDVRGEVGVRTVGLHEDAVLVVAVIGRTEPKGTLGLVQLVSGAELVKGTRDGRLALLIGGMERALGEPDVEVAATLGKHVLDVRKHGLVAALAEVMQALLDRHVERSGAVLVVEDAGDVPDIGTAVRIAAELTGEIIGQGVRVKGAVDVIERGDTVGLEGLKGLVDRLATSDKLDNLAIALLNGAGERVHLVTGVVDVELARDIPTAELQRTAHGVAQSRPATVAHVHGAHGVGADELDVDLLALAVVAAAEVGALADDLAEDAADGLRGKAEVQKARTRCLNGHDSLIGRHVGDDGGGDVAGSAVRGLGAAHSNSGGPVTLLGVIGPLDAEVAHLELGQLACGLSLGDGARDETGDTRPHSAIVIGV